MNDKRELKEQYKQMKPTMGVWAYVCKPTGKQYLFAAKNINAEVNKIKFQLELGNCPVSRNLLADYKQYGESNFEIVTIEELPYDKDELKTDYTEDLAELRRLICENLTNYELVK